MNRWLAGVLVLIGCARHQEVLRPQVDAHDPELAALSAGEIGCPPTEIEISEYQNVLSNHSGMTKLVASTWSAKCRGRTFYCTGANTTRCHELIQPATTPPAS